MNKKSLLKRFLSDMFEENFEQFIDDVESTIPKILITDNLNQVFKKEPYDPECWIQFTHFFLKEINFTLNEGDCIEIIYNVNSNDVLFFAELSQLNNIMREIDKNGLIYSTEIICNEIFYNII